jgi:alkyl hydroperoxide reductase subunit F
MLDASLKQQLQTYLERVTQPLEIVESLDHSDASREMLELLEEIASLSSLITLKQRDEDDVRKPSFALNRIGSNMSLRFAGIPMGHEFTSLVLALLQVGGYPPKVDDAVVRVPAR